MNASPDSISSDGVPMLRHTLAALAYRAEKVLRDPRAELASFRVGREQSFKRREFDGDASAKP